MKAITWQQIAGAPFPLLLKCRSCKARLVGNHFVLLQALTVPVVPLLVAIAGIALAWPLSQQDVILVLLFTLSVTVMFTIANVFATVSWGRYKERK